jgi:hypothetical protein
VAGSGRGLFYGKGSARMDRGNETKAVIIIAGFRSGIGTQRISNLVTVL